MIEIMSTGLADRLRSFPGRDRALAPGQYLFHRGDPVRVLYQVLAGEVRLTRHQTDGATLVLQRAVAGDILAEASLFVARYHCDAIAATASSVRSIATRVLRERLAREPGFAEAWSAHLAGLVQRARLRAEILSLKTVAAKLEAWLAWNEGTLPPKGDWKSLAAEIGTSPEALYRELGKRRLQELRSP
jgi:CRP-like cAMP-binding protein